MAQKATLGIGCRLPPHCHATMRALHPAAFSPLDLKSHGCLKPQVPKFLIVLSCKMGLIMPVPAAPLTVKFTKGARAEYLLEALLGYG